MSLVNGIFQKKRFDFLFKALLSYEPEAGHYK